MTKEVIVSRFGLLAFAILALAPTLVRGVDIDSCGQTVGIGETGVLTADIALCEYTGVTLLDRSTLRMNGHTISDNVIGIAAQGDASR